MSKHTIRQIFNNISRGSTKDIRSDHLVVSGALMIVSGATGYTAWRMWRQMQDNKQSSKWPATRGMVTYVTYPKDAHRRGNEPTKLRYKYSVVDREFQGSNLSLKMIAPGQTSKSAAEQQGPSQAYRSPRYNVGDRVLVFFKPSDPSVSCLRPASQREMMHPPDVVSTVLMGSIACFAALTAMRRMRLAMLTKPHRP